MLGPGCYLGAASSGEEIIFKDESAWSEFGIELVKESSGPVKTTMQALSVGMETHTHRQTHLRAGHLRK